MVRNLPQVAPDLQVVPIAWAPLHHSFRRISADEYEQLLVPTGDEQPIRRAPPQSTFRRQTGAAARRLKLDLVANRVRHVRALRAEPAEHRDLLLGQIEPNSVFLEVDATWNATTPSRRELIASLASNDVTVVSFIQDIFCVTHPEWFGSDLSFRFAEHLDAHLRSAHTIVTSSNDTALEIERYAKSTNRRLPAIATVALGADTAVVESDPESAQRSVADDPHPYVLSVGTIEPRKRHHLVLDAVESLRGEFPDLGVVVVGREGWGAADLVERLRSDAAVSWRHDVSDAELAALYQSALVTVAASEAEGFGLPVVEALRNGSPVIATTGGALAEIAPGIVDHVDVDSSDPAGEIARLIRQMMVDEAHAGAVRRRVASYVPSTWAECATGLASIIRRAVPSGSGC